MTLTSERIINALQEGAEAVLPEGVITSVQVTANLPEAIKDAQEAIKNALVVSQYGDKVKF
jgi:ribosomal protein L15